MDFLGKFGKTMADVGENIGLNSEVTRINNEIEIENEKINQLLFFIGKSYYEAHKDDRNSEEYDRILQVNNSLSKIEQLKGTINKLRNVIVCENCGSEIPADSSFCVKCGAKIKEEEDLVCPSCKKPVEKDEVFCRHCGSQIQNKE